MAQNLLRLRRSVATIHRALSATSSLPSVPCSSPYSSSAVIQPSPTFQIQFQSRSFRSSSISFSRPNSSPGSYNQNEEIGPDTILFEGCDYNHWLIVMDFPKDNKPPPQEMVRTYEETCANGLNISLEEAKKKIYACSTTTYTGFQVLMSEEESETFNGLPGVIFVLPDSYIDPQNKEYGGDKYDNGVITHRPPPFQYERQGSRYRDRNRYDRPMPNQQGNSSYGQPGSPQGGGNYRASQPGSPQQTYGSPGQGENRGHTSVNSPGGRDAYQPGRDPIPSYQGNYNQQAQRNVPQGDQSTYAPPSQGEHRGSERTSGYGQGPSSGSYGQGPSTGSYGQGPSAGTAGSYALPQPCRSPSMAFVKSHKSRAYFKRFQVKYKRRREGKTDYRARIRLINQDKNKYNTPKYRFVVRFTNKDIVAQIVSASIAGDLVLASAYAHELPHYGLDFGLTNYAAAYCTGLLLARRVLKTLEMDAEYEGNVEATGEDYSVEPTESRRPFRALLDVGLIRTTTGNCVFGALKGALDGGLDIPHSEKRFAGFSKDSKQLDAEVHRKYIYGGHVAAYMRTLMEDEPEKYQTHFSEYLKKGIEADNIEEVYKKVHAAIRADPTMKKPSKPQPSEHKRWNLKKLTYEERKNKLIERLNAFNSAAHADDDDDE